jgi:hypothetical protein
VQALAGQAGRREGRLEAAPDVVRIQRSTERRREDEVGILPARPGCEPLLEPLLSVLALRVSSLVVSREGGRRRSIRYLTIHSEPTGDTPT